MSRILGRSYDVYQLVDYLQNNELVDFKKDKSNSSWNIIENVKNDIKPYLPDIAIDFINEEKIDILRSPLRIYTFTSVPQYSDEKRFIRYPSLKPIKEYEREYAYYLGLLLTSYQIDTEEEFLEIGREYDDILPLLIDYLYLKINNKEEEFSLKYVDEIKHYTRYYKRLYDNYHKFYEFSSNAEVHDLSENEYKNFKELCDDKDEDMERITMQNIKKLSALDGMLQIIDKKLSDKEYKELVKELMLNSDENRSFILYDKGIDSFGYKRLRKEIDKYKIK